MRKGSYSGGMGKYIRNFLQFLVPISLCVAVLTVSAL